MVDHSIGAIRLAQASQPGAVGIITILQVNGENVLVKHTYHLNSNRVNGKTRVTMRRSLLVVTDVITGHGYNIAVAAIGSLLHDLVNITIGKLDVIIGNYHHVGVFVIRLKHSFIPALGQTPVYPIWVKGNIAHPILPLALKNSSKMHRMKE